MNHTLEVTDVCGHTHHYVDQSTDEAFGKVGPKWPVKLDGVPGEFLHFKSGKILFVPEHTRLVK